LPSTFGYVPVPGAGGIDDRDPGALKIVRLVDILS
jgi:hypothetical protein